MTVNNDITIWHYDDAAEKYIKTMISGIWAAQSLRRDTERQGKNGVLVQKVCKIRIPVSSDLSKRIGIGDYVRLGICSDKEPERGSDMIITEISDNRRGLSPHWRISCE